VPTPDTVKFKYILDKLIMGDNNVLFNGETGTGKSVIVSDYLFQQQQANKFMSTSLNFSAQT
jgi:dynein heavy chain